MSDKIEAEFEAVFDVRSDRTNDTARTVFDEVLGAVSGSSFTVDTVDFWVNDGGYGIEVEFTASKTYKLGKVNDALHKMTTAVADRSITELEVETEVEVVEDESDDEEAED